MEKTKSLFDRLLLLLAVVFFALDVSAQTTISGLVKDETGEGIIGASIMEKGTSMVPSLTLTEILSFSVSLVPR